MKGFCGFLLVIFLFLLFSCNGNRLFDENKTIENNSWDVKNRLSFSVPVTDTVSTYNVFLNIRNAGWYPYSNIFIYVNTTLPDGMLARDTAECVLADPQGKWLGDGLGDIWDNRILFKKDQRFPRAGTYRFELEQGMRINPLPGIADAGICIEKAK